MNQDANRVCATWLKARRLHLIMTIVTALDASAGAPYIPIPARFMIAYQNLSALITRLETNRFEAHEFEAEFVAALRRGATVNNITSISETIINSLMAAADTDTHLSQEARDIVKMKLAYFDTLVKTALSSAIAMIHSSKS